MSEILVDGLCLRARAYSSKLKSGSFVSARMVSSVFSFSGRFEPIRETPAEFFQKVSHDFTWLFILTRQSGTIFFRYNGINSNASGVLTVGVAELEGA